jgi:integrase
MNLYVVREYSITESSGGYRSKVRTIGIGMRNPNTNNIIPSPITNFIKTMYRNKGKSLSSQRNSAYAITRFLNYIINQINHKDSYFMHLENEGISGLGLIQGSKYISSLSLRARAGKLSTEYVNDQLRYLIKFYYWLKLQKIIDDDFEITYKSIKHGQYEQLVEVNPFDDIELGTIFVGKDERVKNMVSDFGANRYSLTIKFINIARNIAPDIVLGICFQFFGGLRRSEVVNLTRQNIKEQRNGFILEIRDNQKLLFPNIKNTSHIQVKNPRNQSLLMNNLMLNIYREHLERLDILKIKGVWNNPYSLFLSYHTGLPITGKQYHSKFMKVKKAFLKVLSLEENINDYALLSENSWSTHIGRGVFTNFLLDLGLNPTQIAIARGDRNINSALAYVDEKTAIENMKVAINTIREAYDNRVSTIDTPYLEKWKEVNDKGHG